MPLLKLPVFQIDPNQECRGTETDGDVGDRSKSVAVTDAAVRESNKPDNHGKVRFVFFQSRSSIEDKFRLAERGTLVLSP
jgi:hypothetical protein